MAKRTKIEEWKTVPGCETHQANRHGQIRNTKTKKLYRLQVSTSGHSYTTVSINHHTATINLYSHILVKKLFGIELNVTRPSRRKWQLVKVDSDYNGTTRRKLFGPDIAQIKTLLRAGNITQGVIAQMFGVAQGTISDIKCGVSWKSLGDKERAKETAESI